MSFAREHTVLLVIDPVNDFLSGGEALAMYVFDDELREGFRRGHSLVVFDHWKRVPRVAAALIALASGRRRGVRTAAISARMERCAGSPVASASVRSTASSSE